MPAEESTPAIVLRARDYAVLQAIFLLASLGVLGAMLALELLYRRLSPRHVY